MTWSPVHVAIGCGGSDGRAAVERRVRERGFEVSSMDDFIGDLITADQRMVFDYETRCEIDVGDAGAWKYAFHPSNEILCVSWRTKPGPSRYVAHNCGFELAHTLRHFGDAVPYLRDMISDHRFWSCTAARSRRLALPGKLEGACNVLRLAHRKSIEGHRVMLQVTKPRPQWKQDPTRAKWYDDADRLASTAIYCGEDILAESDLDDALPELDATEHAIWSQIERGNWRGMRLDRPLLNAMTDLVADEENRVLTELRTLLDDPTFSINAVEAVRQACYKRGVYLANLQKETVESVLDGHRTGARPIDFVTAKILEGRQTVGKSSNAKIPAMFDRLDADDMARDYAIYHGAHTGRQTGSKVNPLNFPRPYKGYEQHEIVPLIMKRDRAALERKKVSPTNAVSASLRGTIIAPPGKTFAIGDYTSIEPCASMTMAAQWDAVEILRRRESLYIEMGRTVFQRELDKKKDLREYTICKVIILALGYGMGVGKFLERLKLEKIECSEGDAADWRKLYLGRFPKVPELWRGLEAAAKAALRYPHHRYAYSCISFIFDGFWLVAQLPSGRCLFYPNARLAAGKYNDEILYEGRLVGGAWGDVRTWGGTFCENFSQSISRDITMEDRLELERLYGWHIPLDVYDEIIAECDENDGDALDKLLAVMRRQRSWLPQMPVYADGFIAPRYRKE